MENEGTREWHPSYYPTIRKLPVQKDTNTMGEVGWCTLWLDNFSSRDMKQSSLLHHSQKIVTSYPGPFVPQIFFLWNFSSGGGGLLTTLFIVKKCKMLYRIITAAECLTNEMLVSTWRETEYRLDVYCATLGAHSDIYWIHEKLCEVQWFLQYTWRLKIHTVLFHCYLRSDIQYLAFNLIAITNQTLQRNWWYLAWRYVINMPTNHIWKICFIC